MRGLNNDLLSWWRHQMETFSMWLAISVGNSPVPGEFSAQRPVTRSFDVFFDLRPNKRLSKQSWGWWFETPSWSLWRHCNVCYESECMSQYHPQSNANHRDRLWQIRPITGVKCKFITFNQVCKFTGDICHCCRIVFCTHTPWWRHQMETFSALLAICAGNSPVPGEFPAQKSSDAGPVNSPHKSPVTRSFDVFFDLRSNKRLSKNSRSGV